MFRVNSPHYLFQLDGWDGPGVFSMHFNNLILSVIN